MQLLFCIQPCGKKNGNMKITHNVMGGDRSKVVLCYFALSHLFIYFNKTFSETGLWHLLIETQRNMKHLFLIKVIEEQQKIRSVLKEFISQSPHI